MDADGRPFKSLLESSNQLQIPIYQRTYDWGNQHCKQLYDDVVEAGRSNKFHCMGAITLAMRTRQPQRYGAIKLSMGNSASHRLCYCYEL